MGFSAPHSGASVSLNSVYISGVYLSSLGIKQYILFALEYIFLRELIVIRLRCAN